MIGLEPTTVCEGAECLDVGDAAYGIANLWPEPADPRPAFHEKDQVENTLHDQVSTGAMPLQQA